MKDNIRQCQHNLPEDVIYKEVVVVGNGPSGMVTSFMLAGNVPYLKKVPDDLPLDDMLKTRLSNVPEGQSLYETDLMELAEGLEGRSHNPIPLLMDSLLRPCTDLDIEADPLIEWRYEEDKEIDHIVLGEGSVGGSWASFPAGVVTLSPARWLWLPPRAQRAARRLPATAVAAYCRRYVLACRIQKYFRCNAVVTSVRPLPRSTRCTVKGCPMSAAFLVTGYDKRTGVQFRYACNRTALCGGGARTNTLAPQLHAYTATSLSEYDRALAHVVDTGGVQSVLVVGGGVSGADAVRLARARGLRALHAHRRPAAALAALTHTHYPEYCQIYKMMMDGPNGNHENYTSYPYHIITEITPDRSIPYKQNYEYDDRILCPKRVKLLDVNTNQTKEVTVSVIGVFIGTKPDLSFLQMCEKCTQNDILDDKLKKKNWHYIKSFLGQSIQHCKSRFIDFNKCQLDCQCFDIDRKCKCQNADGIGFGLDPSKPVDSKNPIAIDKSSHEVLNAPKGLYAMGPLTGDNFVRFIPGGALAAVAHIHKDRQ